MHESVSFIHSQGPDKPAGRIFDLISSMLEVMNQRSVVNKYGHDWASLPRPGYEIVHLFFLGVCSSAVKLVKEKDSSSPDGGQDGWKGMEGWKFNKRASKSQFSFLIMCYYREVLGKGVRECCVFLHLRGNRLLVEGKIEDRRKEKKIRVAVSALLVLGRQSVQWTRDNVYRSPKLPVGCSFLSR